MTGPLAGIRVLDLSRVLAGPSATQLLGDLGAEVIKIEHPERGDDTRGWGPPYVETADDAPSDLSAYFCAANRNKQSVALDIAQPEGQRIARELAAVSDVVVENFKVGGLAKFGLSHDDLKDGLPALIYCSITGFGQTGPYRHAAGYDYTVQGMGGIMSLTGEPEGEPMKVGVAIADLMCGMYAATAILAALRHRDATGEGQHIDLGLLDTQVAWLANQGLNHLTTGTPPPRHGNEHPNIVPYKTMPCRDGHLIVAAGNDAQFQRLCAVLERPDLAEDARFATNRARVANRAALYPILEDLMRQRDLDTWVQALTERGIPCGPVNTLDRVFADPQVQHRGMQLTMAAPGTEAGQLDLLANPIGFSATPVSYRSAPPRLGEHTEAVLRAALGLDGAALARLRSAGVISG